MPVAATAPAERRIAYFSMEVGLDEALPIYAGGLGVLAADTLRSFADLRLPAVGVSLLYTAGYFRQVLDGDGNQQELPVAWDPATVCRLLDAHVALRVANRPVLVRAWQHDVVGAGGYVVPLVLLDTDFAANDPAARALTRTLYGGGPRERLGQEMVLGIGGVRMLRALGYGRLERYHLNEGHAALLALELLREQLPNGGGLAHDLDAVRRRCVFTTHTPVPAAHDRFDYGLVGEVLGDFVPPQELRQLAGEDHLNPTRLALELSHFVNGVAKRHRDTARRLFPGFPIEAITNGVHSRTWTCPSFRELFDRRLPGWDRDPFSLRYAVGLPADEVWAAHADAKAALLAVVRQRTGRQLPAAGLTLGFARRATAYKRHDLIFRDLERLRAVAREAGPVQLVFAGKAHPHDAPGRELIRRVFAAGRELADAVPVVWLEDYDLELAKLLTAGCDVWLNTPEPPMEASGTSGMKAAHNGVPSLSVLDGWWVEGHLEGVTGWSVGPPPGDAGIDGERDAAELYAKLGGSIAPLFHRERDRWLDVMRRTIAFNGSFFNSHRMVLQYAANAYLAAET
jgi:starch phosphorylase